MGSISAGVAAAIFFLIATSIFGWAGGLPATGPVEKAEQPAAKGDVKNLPILQKWSGDFSVARIERLPVDQREESGGRRGGVCSLRGLHREMKTREAFLKRPLTPASPMGMGDRHKYKARADQVSPGTPGGLAPVKEKSQDDETNSVISAIIIQPKITKEDTP